MPFAGNLLPPVLIYTGVNDMSASTLVLAMDGRFGDNSLRADHETFWEALLAMGGDKGEGTGWGAIDRARLDDLVARGRAGETAALESLYGMFKGPVFGLVYRYAQNRAAAEDLLQDVFLKVFSHMADVRDASTFPAWVFRIAVNTAYSHLRQKRVQADRTVPLEHVEAGLEDRAGEPVERDLRGPLEEAIGRLAPRLRSVFVLHDVQGFKHEEIARTLGCAVGTSKSQLFKARLKVRDFLKAKGAV